MWKSISFINSKKKQEIAIEYGFVILMESEKKSLSQGFLFLFS